MGLRPTKVDEDACGADPLVRGRRPRRPATEIDKAPKSGSGGTRADQGVRPTGVFKGALPYNSLFWVISCLTGCFKT
jgi:hypothetical protein